MTISDKPKQDMHIQDMRPDDQSNHLDHATREIFKHGRSQLGGEIADAIIIKSAGLFMLTDRRGDIPPDNNSGFGLYFQDCRYLNASALLLEGMLLNSLLSSAERGDRAVFELVNTDMKTLSDWAGATARTNESVGDRPKDGMPSSGAAQQEEGANNKPGVHIARDTIALRRELILSDTLIQTLEVQNFNQETLRLQLQLYFEAAFEDIFQVRGATPKTRGTLHTPQISANSLTYNYDGADKHRRSTTITFDPPPAQIEPSGAITYNLNIEGGQAIKLAMRFDLSDMPMDDSTNASTRLNQKSGPLETTPEKPNLPPLPTTTEHHLDRESSNALTPSLFLEEPEEVNKEISFVRPQGNPVTFETDNELFNNVIARSFADLGMLRMRQRGEFFFAAGVPWFVALFGRDSLVTAYQTLAYNSDIAGNTLNLLASYQGKEENAFRDEEPGKILHELRVGEMANLGEIPQTPYYGTIDATPLFLLLLAEYVQWSGDLDIVRKLRPNIDAALTWIAKYGDQDGDGFIEYASKSSRGLNNQGWKDSGNSIVCRDGTLATAPIALCEVQGYVYRAKILLAPILRAVGDDAMAAKLEAEADMIKKAFNAQYWMPEHNYYAVALEKGHKQVDSITSNPGQCLWTEIVDADKAQPVRDMLMSKTMFSGWGVRTLAIDEAAYNPVDYQVGAIWPHDSALIAAGLKNYGYAEDACRIVTGLFDAATLFEDYRLPEVFAGFGRTRYHQPVRYPVACRPQAWAAGALPHVLIALLGLKPDALNNRLIIVRPELPEWLAWVTLRNVHVGAHTVSLKFIRTGELTTVAVLDKDNALSVEIEY